MGLVLLVTAMLSAAGPAGAQRDAMVIGGVSGRSWSEVADRLPLVGLEDTTRPGAVQARQLDPGENIVHSPARAGELYNVLGFFWVLYKERARFEGAGGELGVHPRLWEGDYIFDPTLGYAVGSTAPKAIPGFIDGDPTTALKVVTYLPYVDLVRGNYWYGTGRSYGWLHGAYWTMDLGLPVPVNRIRFYPPQQGLDEYQSLYKNDFPRAYEVSVGSTPHSWLIYDQEGIYHTLEYLVARMLGNAESIVDLRFPTQPVRFVRLSFNLAPQTFTLAEVEVYGEGFPPRTTYLSQALDFGRPVNFGRVTYGFTRLTLGADGAVVESPQAPVELLLSTKTGTDDQPVNYYLVSDLGRPVKVSRQEYRDATTRGSARALYGQGLPGTQAGTSDDVENWDGWTSPYRTSGEEVRSADARRYLQLRFTIDSQDVYASGRLDSIAVEYSPLLADTLVGEVSLLDQPQPGGGVAEVPLGADTLFAYDVRARFAGGAVPGFDALRLDLPWGGHFVGLEMGEPLRPAQPDSVTEGADHLTVYFPSQRVGPGGHQAVRVVFRSRVLVSGTYFTGQALDSRSGYLPQSLGEGDASAAVGTDELRVFAATGSRPLLPQLEVVPAVVTPNGDGVNEAVDIRVGVLGVRQAHVEVEVVDLRGARVKRVYAGTQGPGVRAYAWDGRDEGDGAVAPGLYLCAVAVTTDVGCERRVKAVSVVY
ncbi:MAG: FlgD immunoglobulin-like domain containing protein [Candidatus Latescibacterota bacterium]